MPEVLRVVSSGVRMLVELGKLAATNGRNLVTLLNVSWKGVTALLQIENGQEAIVNVVDISNIICALISCTGEHLKFAAEIWLLPGVNRDASVPPSKEADFRRLCIPIKFFLINTIRISSMYPHQAVEVSRDITSCALNIIALRLVLSNNILTKAAAEALAEIVEPASFILLHTLLCTLDLEINFKMQILENLFASDNKSYCLNMGEDVSASFPDGDIANNLCSGRGGTLKLGKLVIFLYLLQSSRDYGNEVVLQLSKKLDLLLDLIADGVVYPVVLQPHIYVQLNSEPCRKPTWQLMYLTVLLALQSFAIMIASSEAWVDFESFLFRNALHPHTLCRELILDLWCFIARHGHVDLVEEHVAGLITLLNSFSNSTSVVMSQWPMRTLARLSCSIAKAAQQASVEKMFGCVLVEDSFLSPPSAVVNTTLLMEDFPLDRLPDTHRKSLILQVMQAFSVLLSQVPESFDKRVNLISKFPCFQEVVCGLLELLPQFTGIENPENEEMNGSIQHTAFVAASCIRKVLAETNDKHRFSYLCIVSGSLQVISRLLQKLHASDIEDILTKLHDLTKGKKWNLKADEVKEMKPSLAEFLASLSEFTLPEDESNPVSQAIWALYHLVLREQHWALAHVGLASFGYFAARTPCKELWRFVPFDAALAFDGCTGTGTKEEAFMSALRSFLEKEESQTSLILTKEEFRLLQLEGALQEKAMHISSHSDAILSVSQHEVLVDPDSMDLDPKDQNDPPKYQQTAEIEHAMEMLQGGLDLLQKKLPLWLRDSGYNSEQQHQLCDQLTLLADVIAHLDVLETL